MDGVLRVTTTSAPSIVAFRIDTIDCTYEGVIDTPRNSLEVAIALYKIETAYTTWIMQDRIQDKETLQ